MQNATDLFCYDQNSRIGKFFATVRNGRLDDGTSVTDGLHQVGPNHTLNRQYTHVFKGPLPNQLLFYVAKEGTGEFYTTDGQGNLDLQRTHTGWRGSWRQIISGRFGDANLLFYDPFNGVGEFYHVDSSGNMTQIHSSDGWRETWHSIIVGKFGDNNNDDLAFYDNVGGAIQYYKVFDNSKIEQYGNFEGFPTNFTHVVGGDFLENDRFDNLLFYDAGTNETRWIGTDGFGKIAEFFVDVNHEWRLSWKFILGGQFTPNLGIIGTSSLSAYGSSSGVVRNFFINRNTSVTQTSEYAKN